MNLQLFVHKALVPLTIIKFPAKESLVRIETNALTYPDQKLYGMITLDFKDNGDLIDLMLLVDAVRREFIQGVELSLNIPYLPYGRQDRVMTRGESLSVKVIADLINSLDFAHIYIKDIHSDVGAALINNLRHIDMNACASKLETLFNKETTVLVSPDAGANKKVFGFAKQYGFPEVVRADKIRDVRTGKIKEITVYSDPVGDKDFLILDDIFDAGGTFIGLEKELRKLTTGKIYLYCTHGIFSKGAEVCEGIFDKVYTSNLMGAEHPLVIEV